MDICVCVGSSCHLKGSYNIIEELKRLIALEKAENTIELKASFCTNNCVEGVCLTIDGEKHVHVSPDNVKELFEKEVVPKLAQK